MKRYELKNLIMAGKAASYNAERKEEYRRLSMRLLREVRKLLGGSAETIDVRFNPGGIAVCGDATLHADNAYIQISAGSFMFGADSLGILVRAVNSRKDYTGAGNRYFTFESLLQYGAQGLAQFAAQVASADAGQSPRYGKAPYSPVLNS